MMALTMLRYGRLDASRSKNRVCVFAHNSPPPQDAKTNASAKLPVSKQQSTAAWKSPTSSAFFTVSFAASDMAPLASDSDMFATPLDVGSSLYSAAALEMASGWKPRWPNSCCRALVSKMTCMNPHISASFGSLHLTDCVAQKSIGVVAAISASNDLEMLTRSGCSTTVWQRTILSTAPQETTAPPNPNDALLLGRSHFGGRPHCDANPRMECAWTLRSNEHVEATPRFTGDHCTSYRRCCEDANPLAPKSSVLDALPISCDAGVSLGTSAIGLRV
mmetsp:Transcript_18148/g.51681  ORF Transcript_18148/g.51681 Transcript_18148/m.51681 type:complete len:276 (-) Transcript_18148:1013-1840(-)